MHKLLKRLFAPYLVIAEFEDGLCASHHCWTYKDALDWLRYYPQHVTPYVEIFNGRTVASRGVSNHAQ